MTDSLSTVKDIQDSVIDIITLLEDFNLSDALTLKHYFGIYHSMIEISHRVDALIKDMADEEK